MLVCHVKSDWTGHSLLTKPPRLWEAPGPSAQQPPNARLLCKPSKAFLNSCLYTHTHTHLTPSQTAFFNLLAGVGP